MPDQDLTKCSVCGQPATIVVATDKGNSPFCKAHFDLCWNIIPQLLAKLVLSIGEKL